MWGPGGVLGNGDMEDRTNRQQPGWQRNTMALQWLEEVRTLNVAINSYNVNHEGQIMVQTK